MRASARHACCQNRRSVHPTGAAPSCAGLAAARQSRPSAPRSTWPLRRCGPARAGATRPGSATWPPLCSHRHNGGLAQQLALPACPRAGLSITLPLHCLQASSRALLACVGMARRRPSFAELLLPAALLDLCAGEAAGELGVRLGTAIELHVLPQASEPASQSAASALHGRHQPGSWYLLLLPFAHSPARAVLDACRATTTPRPCACCSAASTP